MSTKSRRLASSVLWMLVFELFTAPANGQPGPQYRVETLCPSATIDVPYALAFTDDGPAPNTLCAGQRNFRLFTGRVVNATGPLLRIGQDCSVAAFANSLCGPDSVAIDTHARWPLQPTPVRNLIIAGGACDTLYFLHPTTGALLDTRTHSQFDYIGQIAIDSLGRLFVGSVNGACLFVLQGNTPTCFHSAPGLSPRAVCLDEHDNVYLTCGVDGVMRKLAADGTVLSPAFATGLQGAISQALAPPGLFHGSLFVACGDRVMEVNSVTGTSRVFLLEKALGIAFDPEGLLYISQPAQANGSRILKIGPGLPGDMNGDGDVTMADLAGFVAAIMQTPAAPLPMVTADMNADGCADGADIDPFVGQIVP